MRTAERAQRPGSRRLGGVEATGASVATADSWPDRRKGWASPEWGPALRLAVMGGIDTDPSVLTSLRVLFFCWGGSLFYPGRKATATRPDAAPEFPRSSYVRCYYFIPHQHHTPRG